MKWTNGLPVCPRCKSKKASFLKTRLMWKCKDCEKQYSVKVGTIFEDSAIGLDKWLCAMWLIANCQNGISSYEVGRALEVTQKTAWFMLQRIRYAMHHETINKMSDTMEVDETFVGGAARFIHKHRRAKRSMVAGRWESRLCLACLSVRRARFAFSMSRRKRKHELTDIVRETFAKVLR